MTANPQPAAPNTLPINTTAQAGTAAPAPATALVAASRQTNRDINPVLVHLQFGTVRGEASFLVDDDFPRHIADTMRINSGRTHVEKPHTTVIARVSMFEDVDALRAQIHSLIGSDAFDVRRKMTNSGRVVVPTATTEPIHIKLEVIWQGMATQIPATVIQTNADLDDALDMMKIRGWKDALRATCFVEDTRPPPPTQGTNEGTSKKDGPSPKRRRSDNNDEDKDNDGEDDRISQT